MKDPVKLRAHHGMCLAYFEGKGYSQGFTAHMQAVLDAMASDPLLELTAQADVVCGCCPNLRDGVCNTAEKVLSYDQQVLARCGLEPGRVLPWSEFSRLISQHILRPKTREEICGDCEWNNLCRSREDIPNFR